MATMTVLEFPPRLSLSSQVKVESRYGTKLSLLLAELDLSLSASFEITTTSNSEKGKKYRAALKEGDRDI